MNNLLLIILSLLIFACSNNDSDKGHDSELSHSKEAIQADDHVHQHNDGHDDLEDKEHDDDHGEEQSDKHDDDHHDNHDTKNDDNHDDDHGAKSGDKHDDGDKDGDEHDHGHGGGKSIGERKAIKSVDETLGFKLSSEAMKTLEIQLIKIEKKEFTIDKAILVTSKSLKGIYRFRDDYFKFLPVILLKETNGKYLVSVEDIIPGDQIVTNGVGLLRVADIYSTDESEYGHGH